MPHKSSLRSRQIKAIIAVIGGALLFAPLASAQAQTHTELQTMVQQLQSNPSDTALRERIIQTARQLKPQPAIPAEARDYFIRGTTIAKVATDASGQTLAIQNFERALAIAPWWGDALYNLAVAQELAGRLDAASATLKLYILTGLTEGERQGALDKISMLTAKTEMSNQAQANAAAESRTRAERQAAVQLLAGTWYGKWCGAGDAKGACNEAQQSGSNWWPVVEPVDQTSVRPGPITLKFPESGVVRMSLDWTAGCTPAGYMLGVAQGPSLSDVRWEFHGEDGSTRPIWVQANSNGGYLKASCDRPLTGASADVGYHYMAYSRQP